MADGGVFITFEGGDGSGKSTQIQRVRAWIEARDHHVLVTREPGGTALGHDLRRLIQNGPEDVDARTEALLYAADRAYHVATVVRPALDRGRIVLSDRYIDSSLAYQGAARDLGVDEIAALSRWATNDLRPSLTFLLDLPPEVGARRRTDAPDRLERESRDFHERVRHEYLRLADAEPDRIVVIDAVGTPDEVFSEIRGVLEERWAQLGLAPAAPVGDQDGPSGARGADGARGSGDDEETGRQDGPRAAAPVEEPVRGIGSAAPVRAAGLLGLLGDEAQGALWDPAEDGSLL
ncbi:dTMP kinase [Actinomyces sp. B33]|uniref:dTMP kinase n=1 Tax=Actinomyces sp. B33 TaxID=2942131 RepID=UPI00233F7C35|nr:dTMP kinase [Actinomyces sp. B33]MDC4232397.1 dTMP kinase [Actinomyces sp. B33]